MNEKRNDILHSLCKGDITFSEASESLGISRDDVEKILESFVWVPSFDRISELCEMERDTLSLIENDDVWAAKQERNHIKETVDEERRC